MKLISFDGTLRNCETIAFRVPSNTSSKVYEVETSSLLKNVDSHEVILRSSILLDGKIIKKSDYFFVSPKDLNLPEQKFKYDYEKEQGRQLMHIESLSFLYKLQVRCANDFGIFNRIFFDMIPGDIAKIEYLPSDNYLKTETQSSLTFELNTIFRLSN